MNADDALPPLMRWTVWSLLAAGVAVLLVSNLRQLDASDAAVTSGGPLATWYGRTRAGRRLEARLRRAMIETTPGRWRAGQLLLALPAVAALAVVLGPAPGIGLGVGSVRAASRLLLHARGDRRASALQLAAPDLARCLGAEISAGVSAEEALATVSEVAPASRPALRPLLAEAVLCVAAGDSAGAALTAALATEPEAAGEGLAAVAALLSIQGRAGGDPAAFERVARALEATRATREDANAVTAEARMAAVAVPALAGALGATLLVTQPAIAGGVQSAPAAVVLAGCVLTAVVAAAVARWLAMVA